MDKSCCKCFKRLIKECDCFGTFITFRINEDLEYKSLIGGISTILFILFCIVYILYCFIPFVKRQNVELIYTNKVLANQPIVDFRQSKFMIAFALQFSDSDMEEELIALNYTKQFFDYKIIKRVWEGELDIVETEIPLKICDYDDFFNLVNEDIDLNGIDEMLCPKITPELNLTLDGMYTDDYYKYVILKISLTDYALSHMEETHQIMSTMPMEMIVFFLDKAIDYESKDHPIPTLINSVVQKVDFYFMKYVQMYISQLEFIRDDNIIIDHEQRLTDAMYDRTEESYRFFPERGGLGNYNTTEEVEEEEHSRNLFDLAKQSQNKGLSQRQHKKKESQKKRKEQLHLIEQIAQKKMEKRSLLNTKQRTLKVKSVNNHLDTNLNMFQANQMFNLGNNLHKNKKRKVDEEGNNNEENNNDNNNNEEDNNYSNNNNDNEEMEDEDKYVVAKIDLIASRKVIQISRKYQKFPSFLADTTSLLEEILVLMLLLVNSVERKAIEHKIIKKMLTFNGSKHCDVDYLITKFKEEKLSDTLNDLIENDKIKLRKRSLNPTKNTKKKEKEDEEIEKKLKKVKENNEVELINISNKKNNSRNNNNKNNIDRRISNNLITSENNYLKSMRLSENGLSDGKEYLEEEENNKRIGVSYKCDSEEFEQNIHKVSRESDKNSLESIDSQNIEKLKTNDQILVEKNGTYYINYKKMSLCSIICNYLLSCFCKKEEKKRKILENAENKINNYLDIYNFIWKMQEIDIMKYVMFDDVENELFRFLSNPPFKMGVGPNGIYDNFEEQKKNLAYVGKEEIDNLYIAYHDLQNRDELTFEDIKLLRLLKAEIEFLET